MTGAEAQAIELLYEAAKEAQRLAEVQQAHLDNLWRLASALHDIALAERPLRVVS